MSQLDDIVRLYGDLERQVQGLMTSFCDPFCSTCQSPCCRVAFCSEACESPFLLRVRNWFSAKSRWAASTGWLTTTGCSLIAGRPPVCYEFLCETITGQHPEQRHSRLLNQLAMLLTRAGHRAQGKRHLVEVNDLRRLNASRLIHQLTAGRRQFNQIKQGLIGRDQGSSLAASPGGGSPLTPS